MNMRSFLYSFLVFLSYSASCFAQNMPIGYWRAHMPYNEAISTATDGVTFYVAAQSSFYTYNAAQNEMTTYSKVEGMADVGMACVGYDATTGFAILVYQNGNIDLFKDETFYNIPDVKLKVITGVKTINNIYTENGYAYLSTSFGIVVVNLVKREIKETYVFSLNNQLIEIREFAASGNSFYAVTSNGLYRADKNTANLQVFSAWEQIDGRTNLGSITVSNNKVFAGGIDSLFVVNNNALDFAYKSSMSINHLDPTKDGVWIAEYDSSSYNGKAKRINMSYQPVDSFNVPGNPSNILDAAETAWVSDAFNGLLRRTGANDVATYKPAGPAEAGSFDILPYNGDVWIAHGGYDANFTYVYNKNGLSHFKDDKWTVYNQRTVSWMSGLEDFIVLAKDPSDGTIYAGAYQSGLLILRPDGSHEHLKENSVLEATIGDPTAYRVSGLVFDEQGNLWVNQAGAPSDLLMKTREGLWKKFRGGGSGLYSAYVTIDDYNQKWYILPTNGVAVYNDNYTPENSTDDVYAKISTSEVNNGTLCIVKDKQGAIWIGTKDGIGVINCPDQILQGNCKVDRPIVQYDQFAGYLFQNESVNTIAVDGANRKWIGTTNGVWLISPDGDKIIYRFTADNSPLPSNNVKKIAVDPITGDVYVGTSQGMVSYRSTATEGGEVNENVTTFPNPVPSGYNGTIAIKGISENADVRITDISGQLIYRTKALGGQAVWNGLDYTGRRPQSGVYLIFITNRDGSQKHIGKMVFME